MCVQANLANIYLRGMRDRRMRSGTELAREIQQTDWSIAGEQGKLVFVVRRSHHWRNLFHFWQRETEKSSFDRPNYTSISVFHFKVSVKKKRRKEIRFGKQKFWKMTNFIISFMVKQFSSNQFFSLGRKLRRFFADDNGAAVENCSWEEMISTCSTCSCSCGHGTLGRAGRAV